MNLAILDLDLDPISVGFDLRLQNTAVVLPAGDTLTVRYQTRGASRRELRTIQGTRAKVTAVLRRHGYRVQPGVLVPSTRK